MTRAPSRTGIRKCPLVLLLLAALLLSCCAGKKLRSTDTQESVSTSVALDRSDAVRLARQEVVENRWLRSVYPPRYFSTTLPEYPPAAIADRVPEARVRVDFTVGVDGRVRDPRAELFADTPHGEAFATACLGALSHWRFSPAWRLPREGETSTDAVVLLDYEAHLVFRFDLEVQARGGEVGVEFSGSPTS